MQIVGALSIVEVKGAPTKSNRVVVRIERIGLRGLRFFSDLRFPLDSQIILGIRIVIDKEILDLKGLLIGSEQQEKVNIFKVEFRDSIQTKEKLTRVLADLAGKQVSQFQKADYCYNYFAEPSFICKKSSINLWM